MFNKIVMSLIKSLVVAFVTFVVCYVGVLIIEMAITLQAPTLWDITIWQSEGRGFVALVVLVVLVLSTLCFAEKKSVDSDS